MSVPYTFGTNTYAQSGQLDANFAALNSGLSNIDASQITTGTLPVARGGTGSTTVAGAPWLPLTGGTVTGVLAVTNYVQSTGGAAGMRFEDRANPGQIWMLWASAGLAYIFNGASVQVWSIDGSGQQQQQGTNAYKPGGGSWTAPSARHLKQDIQPYTTGIEALLALNPVTYRYNEESGFPTDHTHVGLVYNETAHMPEMHRKARIGAGPDSEGREVDALDCSAVTWALVNAVKTLAAKVEALEKR